MTHPANPPGGLEDGRMPGPQKWGSKEGGGKGSGPNGSDAESALGKSKNRSESSNYVLPGIISAVSLLVLSVLCLSCFLAKKKKKFSEDQTAAVGGGQSAANKFNKSQASMGSAGRSPKKAGRKPKSRPTGRD